MSAPLLDERLRMLSALTPACDVAADVGADHGFLGAELLMSGKCRRVWFMDISAKALSHARALAAELELGEAARFAVSDGLEMLPERADAVIIAGMGAPTIAGIVERGRDRLRGAALIVQPNVGAPELRRRLAGAGFRIAREELARAGGRWYLAMSATEGAADYDERALVVGPILSTVGHPLLSGYREFRLRVARKAYAGAKIASPERAEELKREIELWESV